VRAHLIITLVTLFASSGLAAAGSLDANSSSTSTALGAAQSAAGAISSSQGGQGGNVTFNTPGSTTSHIKQSGTTTIRSAPQVVAPSMSSGHPCAWAPVSLGISVVGFGGALGGQKIDDACLLGQLGERAASVSMIAARNPSACRALAAVGRIPAGYCGGRQSAANPSARPATPVQTQYVKVSSLKKGQLYRKNGVLYRKQ
jgi:hypothetical protein